MNKLITQISKQLQDKGRKVFKPIIISDIDGVLLRGKVPIPGTYQALQKINQYRIPFACLTNGGGQLQSSKTKKMNQIFQKQFFHPQYMFMNHSPLRPQLLKYKDKGILLVFGSLRIEEILQDLNITNYITADEFFSLYFLKNVDDQIQDRGYLVHKRKHRKEHAQQAVQNRLKRKVSHKFSQEASLVSAIFALNDVHPYETPIHVVHNLLHVHHHVKKQTKPMPFYASQNDLIWAGGYHKPRIAFGPFNYVLKEHCKVHNFPLIDYTLYGKPYKKAFGFVQKYMKKECEEGTFFMVGDNPRADIRGANNIGWYSFLTKTGIHMEEGNSKTDPATMVVQNFAQAVDIVLKLKQQLA